MPKSKHSHKRQDIKKRKIAPVAPLQTQQTVAQPGQTSVSPRIQPSTAAGVTVANQYPYIGAEIRNICIVTGIMIAILLVLYFLLR